MTQTTLAYTNSVKVGLEIDSYLSMAGPLMRIVQFIYTNKQPANFHFYIRFFPAHHLPYHQQLIFMRID